MMMKARSTRIHAAGMAVAGDRVETETKQPMSFGDQRLTFNLCMFFWENGL